MGFDNRHVLMEANKSEKKMSLPSKALYLYIQMGSNRLFGAFLYLLRLSFKTWGFFFSS